jgi:crotonobetainyl-CoA:carnitine CoA-transferase CaiB-like acyl-CoA transferase
MCGPISKCAPRACARARRKIGSAVLEKADVPAGRVHTIESLAADEHLADVGFFRKVEHPVEGEIIDLAFPNRFSAGGRQDFRPAPLMGGDSVEILREIGYRNEEIDELVRSRVTTDGRNGDRNRRDGDNNDGHKNDGRSNDGNQRKEP